MGVQYDGENGDPNKNPSLIMEYLPSSVEDCITKCKEEGYKIPLSIILKDVSCGLCYLHFNNVIHRDLSASNVLLTSCLQAKIADLGVSKLLNPLESMKMTENPGTPYTLPPGAHSSCYMCKYDIYSFSVLSVYFTKQELPMNPSKFSDEIKSVEKTCGAYLKTVLERCAKVTPNDRLSAAKLTAKLAKCIKSYVMSDIQS